MSSSRQAQLSVVFGAVATLAIPVACGVAAVSASIELLGAVEAAVAVAVVAGLFALGAYRRARAEIEQSVWRSGEATVRAARILALTGLYVGITGALALGFYGLLNLRS